MFKYFNAPEERLAGLVASAAIQTDSKVVMEQQESQNKLTVVML